MRDEEEEPDYSQDDFVSESIHSESFSESKNLQSVQALKNKAADIEESGYTDNFDEASQGISQSANALKTKL